MADKQPIEITQGVKLAKNTTTTTPIKEQETE